MKGIKKISDFAIAGGIGALVMVGLSGCEQREGEDRPLTQAQSQGAFVVIEQMSDGGYKIAEEYPSPTTRVILRELNGNERILSDEEIQHNIKQEVAKIDNGTSALTNESGSTGVQ